MREYCTCSTLYYTVADCFVASTSTRTLPCCVFPVITEQYTYLLQRIQPRISNPGNDCSGVLEVRSRALRTMTKMRIALLRDKKDSKI